MMYLFFKNLSDYMVKIKIQRFRFHSNICQGFYIASHCSQDYLIEGSQAKVKSKY